MILPPLSLCYPPQPSFFAPHQQQQNQQMIQQSYPQSQIFSRRLQHKVHQIVELKKKKARSQNLRAVRKRSSNKKIRKPHQIVSERLSSNHIDNSHQDSVHEEQKSNNRQQEVPEQNPPENYLQEINNFEEQQRRSIGFQYRMVQGKKRRRKEYYCKCSYKSFNVCHIKRHLLTCKKLSVSLMRRRQSSQEGKESSKEEIIQQISNNQQMDMNNHGLKHIIKITLDELLEQKLLMIGKTNLNLANINDITLKIYQTIQKGIRQSIITNLRAVLEQKLMSDSSYIVKPKQLGRQVLRLVSELDFNRCVLSYVDELQKSHRKIQQKIQKTSRTYQNNQRCFERFKLLNEIDLRNSHRLYDIAASLQKFVRQDMRRYFNIARRQSLFLSEMLQFPVINQSIAKRSRPIPISYVAAANDIQRLFQSGQKQLATDMWATMVLALRADDLLKIRLITPEGDPVKIVRLTQKKTGSVVDRYIPKSLIQLALASRAEYPMTTLRLKRAVRECLNRYRSAYGFKHRAITQIIVSLAQSNKFLNFHRKSSMTFKYYLDKNQQRLLDMAFTLGINFIFDQREEQLIQSRCLLCNVVNINEPQYEEIKEQKLAEITIDCRQNVQERLVSASLDLVKPNEQVLAQVKEEHLGQLYYLKNKYDVDSSSEISFRSIQNCISSICTPIVYQNIQNQVYQSQASEIQQIDFCRSLSNSINTPVVYHQFEEDLVDPVNVRQISHSSNTSPTLMTSVSKKNGQKIFKIHPSESIRMKTVRKSKTDAIKNMRFPFLQKHRRPKCPICLRNKKVNFLSTKDKSLVCESQECYYKDSFSSQAQVAIGQKLVVITTSNQYALPINCPPKQHTKNNLEEAMGDNFSLKSIYSTNLPDRIDSKLLSFDLHAKTIDRFFRIFHYLPFEIRESSIEGAGRGMFATRDLQSDSLVGIYNGFIGNHYDINPKSDSLYGLGWYFHNDHWNEILSDGCLSNCGTRFMNTNKDSRINVRAFQGVLNKQTLVLYITARKINEGEQMFVKYGNLYNLDLEFDQFAS